MFRAWRWLGVIAIVGLTAAGNPQQPPASTATVKVVNYRQLGETVKQLKGRVIVVDFWALTCIECVREFPHLVELHRKYAPQGVSAISVNLDDSQAKDTVDKVRHFLDKQGADLTNLILDERPDVWQSNLRISGLPCVFVFNRQGQVYKKYDDGVKYSDVEKDVRELLSLP